MPTNPFEALLPALAGQPLAVLAWDAGSAAAAAQLAACRDWLSADEQSRLAGFARAEPARLFLAGRVLLRGVLGALAGCAPAQLQLGRTTWEKPVLQAPACGWQFNLSHSHGWLVLAVSRIGEVGVDTEWTARHNAIDKLAQRYFSRREQAWLAEVQGEAFRQRFFDTWTLKEAYIKAVGKGLAVTLEGFSFTACDGRLQFVRDGGEAPAAAVQAWLCRALPGRPLACVLLADAPAPAPRFLQLAADGMAAEPLAVSAATAAPVHSH